MTIKVEGTKELSANLDKFNKSLEKAAINSAKRVGAVMVQGDAVKSIQRGSPSGTTYKKINPKRRHKASAAGEAPASDTGRLAGSIQIVAIKNQVFVGTNLVYAPYLEFGTRDIAARPFLFPAFEKNKADIIKAIDNAGKKTIKEHTK